MSELIQLPNLVGFHQLPSKQGASLVAFLSKPNIANEYGVGESIKITGVCSYQFLSSAGIVRGLLITSPKVHTVVSDLTLRIGPCPGPFSLNTNLQQLGILIYESPDSSIMFIPVDVKSPLLVEVDR